MTQISSAATEAARRLWARDGDDAVTPEELAAAAERVFAQLYTGLGRWVGAEGYRMLRSRAVGLTRSAHPALGAISGGLGDEEAVVAAVRAHGAAGVVASIIVVMATLIDLLARIIGEEMAVQLVEQTVTLSPRRAVTSESRGGHDG